MSTRKEIKKLSNEPEGISAPLLSRFELPREILMDEIDRDKLVESGRIRAKKEEGVE